jgi:hypothetical protein
MKVTIKQLERLEDYLALILEEYKMWGCHKHSGISYDEIAMIKRIIDSKQYLRFGHDRDNLNRIEKWFNETNKIK